MMPTLREPGPIEAVILAGGSSTRMGRDKATIPLEGIPSVERIARALVDRGLRVTILGGDPVAGLPSVPDAQPGAGPLPALASYAPSIGRVFVASCDLVRFDARVLDVLGNALDREAEPGSREVQPRAAVPEIRGRLQPLCALYTAVAFGLAAFTLARGRSRVFDWLEDIEITSVPETEFTAAGIDPRSVLGANTPDDLRTLLSDDSY